jgi:murein DD-endopeptidase MepM/ murein hydrolase activator NlpD
MSAAAPHLHYEVWRDTLPMDPVNYLFTSVTPEDYARMMSLSVNTKQSMD